MQDLFKQVLYFKKKPFLVFFLILILISSIITAKEYTQDYNNPITYSMGDLRWCRLYGVCTFDTITTEAIITKNLSVIGEVFNVTMNLVTWNITDNFNVGGNLIAKNGTFDNIAGNGSGITGILASSVEDVWVNETLEVGNQTFETSESDVELRLLSDSNKHSYLYLMESDIFGFRLWYDGSGTNIFKFDAIDNNVIKPQMWFDRNTADIDYFANVDMNDNNLSNVQCLELNDNQICSFDEINASIGDINVSQGIGEHWLNDTGDDGTGNYTFGGTVFHIDDTRDRVGIGTASPSHKLTIIGDILLDDETTGVDANSPYNIFRGNDFNPSFINWAANESFTKCKDITITISGSTLTDFPVYVNVTYDSDMQADYDDLRFYDTDCNNGGNLLNYEIENHTATKADIWVKTTLTSGTNTISVYYGNVGASNGENATGVWNDNYMMVQHLQETDIDGGVGDIKDSTSYGNNGTTFNMDSDDQVAGKIDGSFDFGASAEVVKIQNNKSFNFTGDTQFTIEFWMNADNQDTAGIVDRDSKATAKNTNFAIWNDLFGDDKVSFFIGDGSTYNALSEDIAKNLNTWFYYTAVYYYVDGTNNVMLIYKNGTQSNSRTTALEPLDVNKALLLGAVNQAGGFDFEGKIDEVRISNTTRSADWINQSYQLVQNQGTYVVFGSEEVPTGVDTEINISQRLIVSTTTDYRLAFFNTIGTEILSMLGNGKVGIGTTTPNEKLTVNGSIDINNNSITDVYCVNFSNGDTMCGNSSIDVTINGSKYFSISNDGIRMYDDNGTLIAIFNDEERNNTARFEGSMMNNDNINDTSRFVERNLNNGSGASSALTVRNDIPYSASFGLTSSTFSYDRIGANTAGISSVAPGEMVFMQRYNYPIIWYINKENDSSIENLSKVMRLDEDGLNVSNNLNVVGNITGNRIYGNLNRGGNATTRPSSVNVSTGTLISGNITSIQEIDGDVLEVDEVTGSPGFDIIVNYTNFLGTPRRVEYVGRYQGTTSHNVEIRIFNYSSGSYGEINSETGDIPSSSENLALSFMIEGNLSDFVSDGVVSLQVIHTSNGVPSHKQFMDFLTVTSAQYSIPDVGQFVKIDNYGTSSSNGVKVDSVSGNMTILIPGSYRTEASSSFVGDANSFLICSVFKNDIEVNTLRFVRRLNAGGDIASACLGKVLDNLEVNDILNLRCASEIENSFVTFTNLDFYIERIGD